MPLTVIADGIRAALDGSTEPTSWQRLMTGDDPSPRELRRFVLTRPVLDFSLRFRWLVVLPMVLLIDRDEDTGYELQRDEGHVDDCRRRLQKRSCSLRHRTRVMAFRNDDWADSLGAADGTRPG